MPIPEEVFEATRKLSGRQLTHMSPHVVETCEAMMGLLDGQSQLTALIAMAALTGALFAQMTIEGTEADQGIFNGFVTCEERIRLFSIWVEVGYRASVETALIIHKEKVQ